MPPPRVNYKDLPKAARDQIDKDQGQKQKEVQAQKDKEFKIRFAAEAVKARQESEERGSTAKDFREMKKRNETKEKEKPKEPTTKQKVVGFLKDRAEAIAHETRDIRRPRGNPMSSIGMGLPSNPDLFGVGGFGGGGGLHGMMGADPFHEMFPRQAPPPRPAPQKKKRKGKTVRRAAPGGGAPPGMFGGIPKGMKWMF